MKTIKLKPRGVRLLNRHWLWVGFLSSVLSILLIRSLYLFSMEILIALLTLVCGVFYFLHQQHLEKARFFKELVTYFNQRYDSMNNELLSILGNSEPFDQKQQRAFVDYFNLCAEEYLFYEAGYIYERVWNAWYNGMKQFGRDMRVAEIWKQEIYTDSYYGFKFPIDCESIVNN